MIGWITEQDRRQAVLIHDRRMIFELLNQDCSIYQTQGSYHLKLPYGCRYESKPAIEHQAVSVIRDLRTQAQAAIFWSVYDKGYGVFRRYVWGSGIVTLGSSIDDDIYVQDKNLKPGQFLFDLNSRVIIDRCGSRMADLSGCCVGNTPFFLGARFRVLNVQVILWNSFIAVSSAANTYCSLPEARLAEGRLPVIPSMRSLNRTYAQPASRFHYETELREPLPAEKSRKRPLLFLMGPALMMSSASLTAGLMSAYNAWLNGRSLQEVAPMIILPSVMILSTLLWNPLQRLYDNRTERKQFRKRNADYETYLRELKNEILNKEAEYASFLEQRFASSVPDSDQLWRALPGQSDFLWIRLGTGPVHCSVSLNAGFRCTVNDPIPEMIAAVRSETEIHTMPVMADLNGSGVISVTWEEGKRAYLAGLFLQLLFYHGPDVLHVIFLVSNSFLSQHPQIRELPHVMNRSGFRDIATTISEAAEIERSMQSSPERETILICLNPSLLSVFGNRNFKVIFPCGNGPVPADTRLHVHLGTVGYIRSPEYTQTFSCDNEFHRSAAECIGMFRHVILPDSRAGTCGMPSFLRLYGGNDLRSLNIAGRWESSDTQDHMYAYLGTGDDGETVRLDLNEHGDGPHGLIAGMTGSGKSELIITLLLSLCVNYSPREFQFVMVDFKGGGAAVLFSNRNCRVRHCAGVLSNLDESDIERALVSFQNECLRREQLFSTLSGITGKPVMNLKSYHALWDQSCGLPYLSSLLIIVDEFAELKKEQPEVMKDLISVARVGRSLGIHMILATQKPGGIVDEQIWSNTRFRICLKVQDDADSSEMIHCPDAARIHRAGEGYLLCDGVLTHLQCGYANAPLHGIQRSVQLFDAMKHVVKEEDFSGTSGETQAERIISEISIEQEEYPEAHQLWCEPLASLTRSDLPERPDLWIGITDDYRNRKQTPYALKNAAAAVFSVDRSEKQSFLRTLLAGILESASAGDEVFLIDDLGAFTETVMECGTVCGYLRARDEERIANLLRHLEGRERNDNGICSLLITDASAFYEASEDYRLRLRSLIASAESKHLRIVLCFSSASAVSYRDLALIRERIALKNDSIQDLSAIFEQPVRYRITKHAHALCACPEPTDLCLMETDEAELRQIIKHTAERLGKKPGYVIPAMPKRILRSDYSGADIPLGIDLLNYEWVETDPGQKLLILATYEEELYGFYEAMKDEPAVCTFMPDEDTIRRLRQEEGCWMFMTSERFQSSDLKYAGIPVLYIGTGFKDQYRFTSGYKRDLNENQGILFRTGRNTVLQLVEADRA